MYKKILQTSVLAVTLCGAAVWTAAPGPASAAQCNCSCEEKGTKDFRPPLALSVKNCASLQDPVCADLCKSHTPAGQVCTMMICNDD